MSIYILVTVKLCLLGTFQFFPDVCIKKKTTCKNQSNNIGVHMFKKLSNKNKLVNLEKLYFVLTKYITLKKSLIQIVCKLYNF